MPVAWSGGAAGRRGLPAIDELNVMPEADFVAAMSPLFEGAPRFLARLAATRPFDSLRGRCGPRPWPSPGRCPRPSSSS